MPPEPLPWDRKDFVFKERKHERGSGSDAIAVSGGGGGSSSTPRWRDPYHLPRDYPRSSPRRPPSGHYRQGGYHQVYPEESGGHGCTPSRSGDRFWSEDESFRTPSGRYGGGRNGSSSSRENRGSFRRSPYWDTGDFSRQHQSPSACVLRSVAVPQTQASQPPLKDHGDKTGAGVDGGGLGAGRSDEDQSLGTSISWKPWTRPGNLSLTKAVRSEADETRLEVSVPPRKETPIRSPLTSPTPSEDGVPKKKPRLGWGQGLAKYEKEKVEGPEDVLRKNGSVHCANSGKALLNQTSPKVLGVTGCRSPATPSSVACSSSPGMEDKPCTKAANADNDTSHYSESSGLGFQNCSEDFIKLEHMELNPISKLSSLLADLLQPEDSSSGDSNFTRHTAMNKLLLLKGDISKELEKTECEIDLLENELKSLSCEGIDIPHQSSSTLQADCASNIHEEPAGIASKVSTKSAALKDCMLVEEPLLHNYASVECHSNVEDEDVNRPETDLSKGGKSTLEDKGIDDRGARKVDGSPIVVEEARSMVAEAQCFMPSDRGESSAAVCDHVDENHLDPGSSSFYLEFDMSSHGKAYSNLIDLIMASNRYVAKKASEAFVKALPTGPPLIDIWGSDNMLSYKRDGARIKEKLAIRKCLQKFKERVLTLKFRAFHHLWKEDLRLLSIRKHRPKSQKRFELSGRSSQSASQKHRSSIRSRFTLPAGNLTLVPTTEIVDFTSKLLSDSQIKLYRNSLKMPALILDEKERRNSMFITNNRLVEDPFTLEKEKELINPWTPEEKEVFLEMLATFGKDFTKIASFLDHKTTADCVEFYYKNHKSESFKEVKRRLGLRKQLQCIPTNTYLVTSGKKWKREVNAASLDMLGAVSVVAAHGNNNMRNQQKYAGRSIFGSHLVHGNYGSLERIKSAENPVYERETVAADVLAGICGALSSEAMSSCITSSIDPTEKMNYVTMDQPLTSEVTQNIDEEETCSDEGCGELDSIDWTDEEKSIFIRALSMYGKDFGRISHCLRTRSREQCKIFFSKARKCLGLDVIHQGHGNGGTPISDANGGRSDTDDACIAEMDSAICSTQSCSKMDVDFTQSVANTSSEGIGHAGNIFLQAEMDRSSEQYEAGGVDQEEVETKTGRLASGFSADDKLVNRGEVSRTDISPTKIPDDALRSNESVVGLHEVADKFVTTEAKKRGSSLMVSPAEQSITEQSGVEQFKSHVTDEPTQKDIGGSFPVNGVKTEVEWQFLMPESGLSSRKHTKKGTDAKNTASLCFAPDSIANGNAFHPGNKVNVCPSQNFVPYEQHQKPFVHLARLQKTPQTILMKQEDSGCLLVDSVVPDPCSIHMEFPLRVASQSTLNFEDHRNKQHQNSVSRDFYQQYLSGNPSLNQVDQSLHILRGYPLRVLNKNEMNGDADPISQKVLLENLQKRNGISQLNRFFVPDFNNEKCNGAKLEHTRSGTVFSPQGEDQSDAQLRPCSRSACPETEEQSHRTGDVKLFGKILSHPSSSQKSNSSSHESDCKPPSPKQNKSTLMLPNSRTDGSVFASRSDGNGHMGIEELPLRSYGFWDGSRIQTGFSSLPESALMLAKYQAALANGGVLAEYPTYLQPFKLEGKRHESFPEMQKRNGFEMVSGFQQQGNATRMSMNMVGGGGILVGGGSGVGGACTGVSDPVAAIKMHYAGRAKILTSEESWREDIGGR